jgi:hypothetical protein
MDKADTLRAILEPALTQWRTHAEWLETVRAVRDEIPEVGKLLFDYCDDWDHRDWFDALSDVARQKFGFSVGTLPLEDPPFAPKPAKPASKLHSKHYRRQVDLKD